MEDRQHREIKKQLDNLYILFKMNLDTNKQILALLQRRINGNT